MLILGIIGFAIAFLAVIIGVVSEVKHKRSWIVAFLILGVGLGMIGTLGSMIGGLENTILDA